jgi:hypothetical protein
MPSITVDLSSYFSNSSNSSSPTPEQSFLNEVEAKAKDDPGMAKKIKEAAERAEKARNERIQKALDGSAELELLKGAQGKQFVLKHFYRGKERTLYGVAYPGYDASEEEAKEFEEHTVFFQADKDPIVYTKYSTIRDVEKTLEDYKSPYVIKFFDK